MALASTHVERDELSGGRFRDVILMRPIAYPKDGSLWRMTNTWVASGDPSFPVGVDELAQVRIDPRIAGKSPLLYFGKGQSRVTMALLNANNVSGVVSGNGITFPNAWNNADLTYTHGGHRLQESIYLRSGHPRTFSFRIDEHVGFDPVTLVFGNDFRILDPVLEKSGELLVPLKWLVTQQGGKWVLTVNLPAGDWTGWVLDPTLTLQPDATDGLDAFITSYIGGEGNYGTRTDIDIGYYPTDVYRTLIKFNLSGLPDAAIISSSVLSLYRTTTYGTGTRTMNIYRQKRAWTEAGATWNKYDGTNLWQTAGGFGADDCEQTSIGSLTMANTDPVNQFYNWALAGANKAALDLGNGWMGMNTVETTVLFTFASSDHATAAYRPKLVVEYTLPAKGEAAFSRMFSQKFRGAFG